MGPLQSLVVLIRPSGDLPIPVFIPCGISKGL